MLLQKDNIPINFVQGLDTKTDPKQVTLGKFLALENTIFDKGGLLQKRNGFGQLLSLPDTTSTTLATFNGNLTAIGNSIQALSADSNQWLNTGPIQPVDLNVLPLVRTSTSILTVDATVASNGLVTAVYKDTSGNSYYQVDDSVTGQVIVPVTQLPATASQARVFMLGRYFIVTFLQTVTGTPHLRYIAIPINNPGAPLAATDISTQVFSITTGYDGYIANNNLYLAWNGSDIGGAIRASYLSSTLGQANTITIVGHTATLLSITADISGSTANIWISFYDGASGYAAMRTHTLAPVLAPTLVFTDNISEITSVATNGELGIFYEVINDYSYEAVRTDFVNVVGVSNAGAVSSIVTVIRSVGLASKAFILPSNGIAYILVAYGGTFQPSYYLVDQTGKIVSKLAYPNGAGYATTQVLPSISLNNSIAQIGYLIADQIVSVNKVQGVASAAGIYSQKGINLATFDIANTALVTSEIGNNLNLSGGFLWAYDGVKPIEQGFFVWPEDVLATPSGADGSMSAQQYFYQVTYEWTDAQGNLFRSAPSIPYGALTTTGTSSVTLNIPTLRLTYKAYPNSVRIVIYRWSAAQQIYYQVTSITNPIINNPAVDSITFVDTLSDASILGNVILYTTGGVVEDISAPALSTMTLFKSRLILVDAEDRNLLWYSKQVIESTPVEMSDLFTIYVAPTTGAQGSTGPISALSALDDKLIVFKKDAIYYITGNGPDNTGANNDFSDPTFITATVGCTNQQSIVFMPNGLMFQSDKGIWLLDRGLNTTYIGAPVQGLTTGALVKSAINVPRTNQVRFTMDSGITLMYDYYYGQWGSFTDIPAISSTLYQGLHTYLNSFDQVYQETPGLYLDGSNPVLMSFTTSWFNLAGLQGFERAYEFYLIGEYITPHKLNVQVAYDYSPYPAQTNLITPDNFNPTYGNQPGPYGSGSPFGGNATLEPWRVFLARQKCQSFQITLTEVFDSSFGVPAGAGFTLSGIDLTVGIKQGRPKLSAARQVG